MRAPRASRRRAPALLGACWAWARGWGARRGVHRVASNSGAVRAGVGGVREGGRQRAGGWVRRPRFGLRQTAGTSPPSQHHGETASTLLAPTLTGAVQAVLPATGSFQKAQQDPFLWLTCHVKHPRHVTRAWKMSPHTLLYLPPQRCSLPGPRPWQPWTPTSQSTQPYCLGYLHFV